MQFMILNHISMCHKCAKGFLDSNSRKSTLNFATCEPLTGKYHYHSNAYAHRNRPNAYCSNITPDQTGDNVLIVHG